MINSTKSFQPIELGSDVWNLIFIKLYGKVEWMNIFLVCKKWSSLVKYFLDPEHKKTLLWSCRKGYVDVVEYLWVKYSEKLLDVNSDNLLPTACRYGQKAMVEFLLNKVGISPRVKNNKPIRSACKYGHSGIVKLLLKDNRADPSASKNYAIRWASRKGHCYIVSLLLEDKRVDPSVKNNIAVVDARKRGHFDVVQLLLDRTRNPSIRNDIIHKRTVIYTVEKVSLGNKKTYFTVYKDGDLQAFSKKDFHYLWIDDIRDAITDARMI